MRLVRLEIGGYGRLARLGIDFADGLTVVIGPNEAGKSTIVDCIARMLFGFPRRQFADELARYAPRIPMSGYAATLTVRRDDGKAFEIYRDFSKSDVPTETVESGTRRRVADWSGSRAASPGEAIFGFSLDVYRAAAIVTADDLAGDLDEKVAHGLADGLAKAVGSGGDESAAGAIDRLQRYMQKIGATGQNTPLGRALSDAQRADDALRRYRHELDGFSETLTQRGELDDELHDLTARRVRCSAALAAARLRSTRARITAASACAAAVASAEARLAAVVPAAPDATDLRHEIDAAVEALRAAETIADDAEARAAATDDERTIRQRELDASSGDLVEKRAAAKRLDDVIKDYEAASAERPPIPDEAVAELERRSDEADAWESRARTLETDAAIARQHAGPTALPAIACVAASALLSVAWWFGHSGIVAAFAALFGLAGVALLVLFGRESGRHSGRLAQLRSDGEAAASEAARGAADVAALCRRLGCTSVESVRAVRKAQRELAATRAERAALVTIAESVATKRDAIQSRLADLVRLHAESDAARAALGQRRAALESLLDAAGIGAGETEARIAAYRDSVDAGTASAIARADVEKAKAELARALGDATIASLEEDAARFGVEAASGGDPGEFGAHGEDDLDRELGRIDARLQELGVQLAEADGKLKEFERAHGEPIADVEERAEAAATERRRFETNKNAARIAAEAIADVKDIVHSDFTPALNAAIERAVSAITGGRYSQAWVDQADFTVRVRDPQSGATVDGDALSTGTAEQLQFALRAAAATALGTGERVPLLFDDALAHADDERLHAALAYAASLAHDGAQIVFFTQRGDVERIVQALPEVRIVRLDRPDA